MAMNVSSITSGTDDDDNVLSDINTTPLVDIMLVLLIIFLITVPVVLHTVPLQLPKANNVATQTKPENIVLAIDRDGNTYMNEVKIDNTQLFEKLRLRARDNPQPEVHIRADKDTPYRYVGKDVVTAQRAGIQKLAFITEQEHGSAPGP